MSLNFNHDCDGLDSTHQKYPRHVKRPSLIGAIPEHRPSVNITHRTPFVLHRIPSHLPEHARLSESFSMAHAGHYDVSRWHHHLHPWVTKECARNALPRVIGRFIHPTTATLTRITQDSFQHIRGMSQTWTSRNHRKHRYVAFSPNTERQRRAKAFWSQLGNMRRLEYWNISWWVAQAFTWGSVVWCVNGCAAWLPFIHPRLAQTLITTGWTAFVGATIFEIGSIFGILEAWNRDDTTSFGWSIATALHHKPGEVILGYWGNLTNPDLTDERAVEHVNHGPTEKGSKSSDPVQNGTKDVEKQGTCEGTSTPSNNVGGEGSKSPEVEGDVNNSNRDATKSQIKNDGANTTPSAPIPPPVQRIPSGKHAILQMENVHGKHKPRRWIWFSMDPHYFCELGFLAAFFQLAGATIFWISGFTAIPSIQQALMEHVPAWKGAFWIPQIVGGSGFIISSSFIMLESQDVWYKPKPLSLGWHVGLWNFIGGVGFTACGVFGYFSLTSTGVAYQSALCTFWGSWAFLIGSVVQWYESVNAV